jgi:hypothetical protein
MGMGPMESRPLGRLVSAFAGQQLQALQVMPDQTMRPSKHPSKSPSKRLRAQRKARLPIQTVHPFASLLTLPRNQRSRRRLLCQSLLRAGLQNRPQLKHNLKHNPKLNLRPRAQHRLQIRPPNPLRSNQNPLRWSRLASS